MLSPRVYHVNVRVKLCICWCILHNIVKSSHPDNYKNINGTEQMILLMSWRSSITRGDDVLVRATKSTVKIFCQGVEEFQTSTSKFLMIV